MGCTKKIKNYLLKMRAESKPAVIALPPALLEKMGKCEQNRDGVSTIDKMRYSLYRT